MTRRNKGFTLNHGKPITSTGSSSGTSLLIHLYHELYLPLSRAFMMASAHAFRISLGRSCSCGGGLLRANILRPQSLLKKFTKDGKTPTPSILFAQSHSKEDAQSEKIFEKYEALRVQRGIKEGTPKAEQLYYDVSGAWSKKSAIYGLGKITTLFYEKPTASTVSMGSTYTPSEYSKLHSEL
ncbi:hypothetical protein Cgig2_000253 [Carnegiea gigantea]|uniref:Uncharacterized protein n=1 Tax=Carnegiea gigantea TaxID=171969 RepID=A0A9Q1JTI9_9CARY|nr:hypothetical protein Cgig2_000253 [Carnegiea gigantea]